MTRLHGWYAECDGFVSTSSLLVRNINGSGDRNTWYYGGEEVKRILSAIEVGPLI